MTGTGTTVAASALQLGQSGQTDSELLSGRTLINSHTGVWSDSDTLTLDGSSTFRNSSGATLNIIPLASRRQVGTRAMLWARP